MGDRFFSFLTPEDDVELTDYLWPIVREIIKTAIENEQNLIVEGCYIPFDWRNSFGEQYLQSIRFICLAMSDEYIYLFAFPQYKLLNNLQLSFYVNSKTKH